MGKRKIGLDVFSEASSCRGDRGAEAGECQVGEAADQNFSETISLPDCPLTSLPPRLG